MELVQFAISR